MSVAEQDVTAREEPFWLTVDHYDRLWLHGKLDGFPVSIDLAEKDAAFGIMAAKMEECGFDYAPIPVHEPADNDDERRLGQP
jgi:hypothetical protein